jgi:hypothetical protein
VERVATILVAAHRLPEEQVATVEAACGVAQLRYQRWAGDTLDAQRPPDLLVAGVPAGKRQIPEDLVGLVSRDVPDVGLLLLCNEPLTRPIATLHRGRVTLIGPPLTVDAIANRLRVLVAERQQPKLPPDASERSILAVQYLRPQWWVAGISCQSSSPTRALPLFRQDHAGLTVFISLPDQPAPDCGALDRALEILLAADSGAALEPRLTETVGAGTGLVHLSAKTQEWVFYWPGRACPLWIFSPARLPNRWDLSLALDFQASRLLRLRAGAADLVVALSASLSRSDAAAVRGVGPATAEVELPMICGGPALMDDLVGRLRETPVPLCGMIAEVR